MSRGGLEIALESIAEEDEDLDENNNDQLDKKRGGLTEEPEESEDSSDWESETDEECKPDFRDPQTFQYVSLKSKVLRAREDKDLADIWIPKPQSLCGFDHYSSDIFGINEISSIINDKNLSISQKYRSLGVEEDPFEDDEEPPSCWSWIRYKLSKIYSSQWPL